MYRIVTGVTSDIGVPSTYLVLNCDTICLCHVFSVPAVMIDLDCLHHDTQTNIG